MTQRLKKFMFSKKFAKGVLIVAIPLMLQQLIASSVNLVDNLMVGYLGNTALASVAAVNRYYMVASFGTNGLCMATSVFIAQFYGARQEKEMKESYRFMLVASVGIMLLFCFGGLFFSRAILHFFTQDADVIQAGIKYIQIAAISFLPNAIAISVYSAMRSVGETKIPLRCSVIAVVSNTFLNWVFIFGNLGAPAMGVQGAALATLLARCIEMGLCLVAMYRTDFAFQTKVSELFEIPKELALRIFKKAAPLMCNEVLWSIGMASLFKFYSFRGSDVMSGYSIASTVADIFFTLFGGMAVATTVFVSQPLGANRLEEAKSNGYKMIGFSVTLSLVFAVAMYGSTFLVPFLYSNISTSAKEMAVSFLTVQSVMYWIYMATTQCYFTLRAGGDTKNTLIMDSGFMWLINIPIVALVTYCTSWNYLWIYLIGQFTDVLKLIFSYHLVRKELWVVNLTNTTEARDSISE